MLGLAVTYLALGRLGLLFATTQEQVTLIWAPTGLSLAVLILWGRRLWPGVALGALLTNLSMGAPLLATLGVSLGNTLEALVGAYLLADVLRLDASLGRMRDVLWYVLVGVLGCTMISALMGTASLAASGLVAPSDVAVVVLEWWLGDAGGALIMGSLLLVGARGSPPWPAMLSRAELWLVLLALGFTAALAFTEAVPSAWSLAVSLLAFPFLAWAGLRLGPRGAVLGASVWSVLVVFGLLFGTSPTAGDPVVLSFALGAAAAITGMMLAAAIAEREASLRALESSSAAQARLTTQMEHVQRLEGLGLLAGGIAHDFNNLLVPVRANAELLRELLPEDGSVRDLLVDIETAADNASDLCQQLLTYAGQRQTTLGPVPFSRLIADMRRLLLASIPKRVRLVVDIEDDLPEVDGDASQLRQIVLNLVVNAAEAIGEGRDGRIRLSVRVEPYTRAASERAVLGLPVPVGSYIALEVSDDGPGMDADTAARVFDPFYTTKFKGRGLGLAAVLGIVKAHHGSIAVSSTPGKGTTMRVLLPPSSETSIPPDDRPPLEPTTAGLHVLVVDDEPAVLKVSARVLRRDGHRVTTAKDGLHGVAVFERAVDSIDIVVVDVTMPGLDGPRAVRRMRALRPDLPAVLLSGFDEHGVALTLDTNTGFLRKPFQASMLCATVRRVAATAWREEPVP